MSGDDPTADPITPPVEEEWTPPTKEEWEKAQRTAEVRKRERDEAKREAAKAREEAAKGKPADDADAKVAAAQAASDTRARRAAGITALVEAGMSKAQAKDALTLIKLDKLAVDQDGDVDDDDLSDAVKSLKDKFPGLFPASGKTPKARTADGGGRDDATKTATDRTTDRMMKSLGLTR